MKSFVVCYKQLLLDNTKENITRKINVYNSESKSERTEIYYVPLVSSFKSSL